MTPEHDFGEMVRAQVDNLGCATSLALTYDEATSFAWADAVVMDLAGDGLDDLNRLRIEAPMLRVLAIASGDEQAESARSAGARVVLVEPFPIPDIGVAVRALAGSAAPATVDLRDVQPAASTASDAPWWATK